MKPMKAKCAWFLCVFFLFSFPFEDKVAMDNLERKRTAEEDVDETVEAETQDHMDHTFTGIMWDVRAHDLPFEYIEITSVWLRGKLGPISIWSTPGGFRGKQEDENEWQKNYEKAHGPSLALAEMKLSLPIRLAPNQCKGLYAHASCGGDDQIVYDEQRKRVSLSNNHLAILPGMAHLSDVPFSPQSQFVGWWGSTWRDRREFVGKLSYGIRWLRWNPDVHVRMPPLFRKIVWATVMSRHRRAHRSPLYALTEDHMLYILNSVNWWEMRAVQDDLQPDQHTRAFCCTVQDKAKKTSVEICPARALQTADGAAAAHASSQAGAAQTGEACGQSPKTAPSSFFKRLVARMTGLIRSTPRDAREGLL